MASKQNEKPVFVFMDTLPTVSECVSCIVKYAPTYGSQLQKSTIYEFSLQVEELWCKAFTREHVMALSNIRRKLDKFLNEYRSQVQKKKGNKRTNLKNWQSRHSCLFDLLKSTSNPETFDEDERAFYRDQKKGSRNMALSDKVDEEFEQRCIDEFNFEETLREESLAEEAVGLGVNDIEPVPDISDNDLHLVQSGTRSGLVRNTKCLVNNSTQTEDQEREYTTPIRKTRNFVHKVKAAIATTSSKSGITVEQARRAFQATSEVFYGEKYYLCVKDVPESSEEATKPTHSTPKRPRSCEDYAKYKYVLPSARVISSEKHLQAIQSERNCALAMLDTGPEDKISIHYDTTTRRRVQGDWTSLIVKISNGQSFRLRPLSLAVENRQTITNLLVEEFRRLAEAGNTSARTLWEKVTSLMTDSVAKNLYIEESVAATLNSTHIQFHLLCVSHTCEVFDRGNINVLREAEQKLGLREALTARMPALKSFLSSNKSVTVAALEALNKLVINDGHKSSQWELFDKVLSEKGKTKKHSQFRERRFAKLGYTASTILYHLQDYEELINDTKSNNQLVQACRIYLQCEFILLGLKVLSWFTYMVTLPFLNMVEQSTQHDLLKVLPQLYDDLAARKLDTLSEFRVNYSFEPPEPASAVEKHLLGQFCEKAASDLATQRGREYGFGSQADLTSRATALHTLNPANLEYLPTNNLDCERDLAIFDKLAARSAACSNQKFTAKGIRDEMTVHKSAPVNVERATISLVKILDEREAQWVKEQQVLTNEKLEKACSAALKAQEYVHILLQKCKSWGGPFTSVDELEKCVQKTPNDELKALLRTEVAYRRHTSPRDYQARSNLYKLNHVTTAELKVNLTLILTTETDLPLQMLSDMPTEEDMVRIFDLNISAAVPAEPNEPAPTEMAAPKPPADSDPEVEVNEPCIVIWDNNNKREWYVGICLSDHNDSTYTVEHLERCEPNGDSKFWRHPKRADIQTVSVVQIIPCNVIGSWDLSKRVMTFVLENWQMIDVLFRSFY